jgi:hypothetical protein
VAAVAAQDCSEDYEGLPSHTMQKSTTTQSDKLQQITEVRTAKTKLATVAEVALAEAVIQAVKVAQPLFRT